MKSKCRVLFLMVLGLALAWCIPSEGQVLKGSIIGTVADQQGAVVPAAQVKATNIATGVTLTTKSDNSGTFQFNLISTGIYKVEISAPHFKTAVQSDITVVAGHESGLGTIQLTIGETDTTVEVTAAAPLIDSTQSQITNTFAGTTLQTFAGVQENQGLDNMALFIPGVASARDNGFSDTNGGMGFVSNGIRGRNNDQQIDGQNNNDNSVGGPSLGLSDSEFVSQYVVITNQFGPEYGRNAGSVVNVITKSGTNAWHGSVYGSENNSVLNSMSSFQKNFGVDAAGNPLTGPPRFNDEFGGFTIGGPLMKDKLFFFGGFDQEVISTQSPFASGLLTPTPTGLGQLAACFPGSASVAALTQFGPFGVTGGSPVATNVTNINVTVPGSGTPETVACPNVQMGGVTRVLPDGARIFNFPVRVDYQRAGDTFTGRYLYGRTTDYDTNVFGTAASGYPSNIPALSQAILASWTHNFTSRMVNEARLSFNRLNVEFGGNTIGNTLPNDNNLAQTLTAVSFSNQSILGYGPNTGSPQGRIVDTWQAQDNWNYALGKHTLKAGVNFTYQRSPSIFLPDLNGSFRFGGGTVGDSFDNFANNIPNRVVLADGTSQLDFREYDTFLYGGDDWRITQNLTLNLGLTWTYFGQPANLFNQITTQRESNPATAFWASTIPAGELNAGQPLPLADRTDPTAAAPLNSFGPSVGFAYSPKWKNFLTGDGKTVIRGGYRLLYDPPFYNIFINSSTSAPMVFLQSLPNPGSLPMPAVPTGPNVRSAFSSLLATGTIDPRTLAETQTTPNFGPDKVNSWSLGFERELTKNSAFEVRYVGNHGYNLFQSLNGNPFIGDLAADFPNLVPAGETPCPASQAFAPVAVGRVNCNAGIERVRSNTAFSNYNGLQTEFRANNLFKQLTMRAGYTYSKTLDNVSEIFSTTAGGNTLATAQNPANQVNGAGEYSFSGLDFPNTFTLLLSEQLPFFKEQHGLVGHLLGGWAVSGNYVWESGQRYTPVQASEIAAGTAAGNYYDLGYINSFVGEDVARPFLGNLGAPSTSVGIFCGDANAGFGVPCGTLANNQLISMTALGQSCLSLTATSTTPCNVVPVNNQQVRFIINGGVAQTVFGTPFGNTPRNPVQDAPTNIANLGISKRIKFSERASFEFRATLLNVFNHANFGANTPGIDPILEDAGLVGSDTGFGNPRVTDDVPGVLQPNNEASRRITFAGKITF